MSTCLQHDRQQLLFAQEPTRFDAWQAFHAENPHVYRLFLERAWEAFLAGRKVGARCIWEVIRWNQNVEVAGVDGDDFKMNDHNVPYFSRLVMLRHPQLAGFFDRRDSHFDATDDELLRAADRIDAT
jgi:hypothetical protein